MKPVRWAWTVAAWAAVASTARAQPVVLYDSLFITSQRLYDRAFANCIGTPPNFTTVQDMQVADDFTLTGEHRITRVVADYTSRLGTVPATGVWVQFYADVGGTPAEPSVADYVATGGEVTLTPLGIIVANFPGVRLDVDVSAANIELGAGTWWVDIQPLDVNPGGDWYWILRDLHQIIGNDMHARNGGIDHLGTPYGGYPGLLIYDDWTPLGTIGFGGPGTVPMLIEGIPAGGLRGDLNCDGVLDENDVGPFALALADPAAYMTAFPNCDIRLADMNDDGAQNGEDGPFFVAALLAP